LRTGNIAVTDFRRVDLREWFNCFCYVKLVQQSKSSWVGAKRSESSAVCGVISLWCSDLHAHTHIQPFCLITVSAVNEISEDHWSDIFLQDIMTLFMLSVDNVQPLKTHIWTHSDDRFIFLGLLLFPAVSWITTRTLFWFWIPDYSRRNWEHFKTSTCWCLESWVIFSRWL